MLTEPRSAFLLVRGPADLERDGATLTAYLSDRRRRSHTRDCDGLQGIWIDEGGVANLPGALVLPDAVGGRRIVRVVEATGINGIWMLCWLEITAGSVSRAELLAALLECFGQDERDAALSARFIPVFSAQAPDSEVNAELQLLQTRYFALVLPPKRQTGDGSLGLMPVRPHRNGT